MTLRDDPFAEDAPVRFEKHSEHIGVIRLNRPDDRNSMTPEILEGYGHAIEAAQKETLRVLIVTGSGSCFSAGANLDGSLQQGQSAEFPHEKSYNMYRSFLSTLDVEVPVIAALNGHAVGGGFGLSLLADIRIGAARAKYGANFARLGIHSGLGIAYTLPKLIGHSQASELLFTGRIIRGEEATKLGLFSRALPQEEVWNEALALAEEIALSAPIAVKGMKATLRRFQGWEVKKAAYYEAFLQSATLGTEDADEGVKALLAKRTPRFVGR